MSSLGLESVSYDNISAPTVNNNFSASFMSKSGPRPLSSFPMMTEYSEENETSAYSRAPPPGHQMGQRLMFPAWHSTSVLSDPPTLSAEAAPGPDSLRHKLTSLPSVPSLVSMASSQTSLSHHVSTPCLQPQEADMRSVRSNMSEPIFSATPTPGHGSHQNSLHSHQPQVTPGYPVLTEYSDENETSAYSRAPLPGHQMWQRPMLPASHSTSVLSRPEEGSWIWRQSRAGCKVGLVRASDQVKELVRLMNIKFNVLHRRMTLRTGSNMLQRTVNFILRREECKNIPLKIVTLFVKVKFFHRLKCMNNRLKYAKRKKHRSVRDARKTAQCLN